MEVEGLEINELSPLSGKKKQIILTILGIMVLVGIVFFILQFVQPRDINAYFTDPKIRAGSSTELVIEFWNNSPKDLNNVIFTISPENPNILVGKAKHVEKVIGAGAYRRLEIPVTVNGNLTQGTYRIGISVDAGEKELKTNVYLEIAK